MLPSPNNTFPGAWPKTRPESAAQRGRLTRSVLSTNQQGDSGLGAAKAPRKGAINKKTQRESARSTVFFNTNLTTTKKTLH